MLLLRLGNLETRVQSLEENQKQDAARQLTEANRRRTAQELADLTAAVDQFKQRLKVPYVPSRIKLSKTGNYDLDDKLDAESLGFLRRLWPKMRLSPGTPIDWNGDGQFRGDWILEGDECLVFFLGGIPQIAGGPRTCSGFSVNPSDPAERGGRRVGPFFTFGPDRLRDLHGRGFFSYLDCYGKQPYAYFSSFKFLNNYNRYGSTDCPSLGVSPYAEALAPDPRYLNPESFQIISAGADGLFGPGTSKPAHLWSPASAGDLPAAGRDDQSNFYHRLLGEPSE
jgi:hypothetical protein